MKIHIVFDGPPEPVAGRFVEVEDEQGRSISVGEWIERPDACWALVIDMPDPGLPVRTLEGLNPIGVYRP